MWQLSVPIKTTNPLNGAWGHWTAKAKQRKLQRDGVRYALQAIYPKQAWKVKFPIEVLLVRVAPSNGLDDDSLPASLKSIRDGIADWLGLDDDRTPDVTWRYDQRRGKQREYAVEITMKERV